MTDYTLELLRRINGVRMDLEHPEPHKDEDIDEVVVLLTDLEEYFNSLE